MHPTPYRSQTDREICPAFLMRRREIICRDRGLFAERGEENT